MQWVKEVGKGIRDNAAYEIARLIALAVGLPIAYAAWKLIKEQPLHLGILIAFVGIGTFFLILALAAYSRALELDDIDEDRLLHDSYRYREQLERMFAPVGTNVSPVDELFAADWGDDELRFARISRTSPLAFTCVGVAIALAVAAIISGGQVDITFTGIRFKLPPLGTGIKHLLDAFRLPQPTRRPRLKR